MGKRKRITERLDDIDLFYAQKNLKRNNIKGDGNCLFRAIAHQLYGDQERHPEIRKICIVELHKNWDKYKKLIDKKYEKLKCDEYVSLMSKDRTWAGHAEKVALKNALELQIITITPFENSSWIIGDNPSKMIYLSFEDQVHYSSLTTLDPEKAIDIGEIMDWTRVVDLDPEDQQELKKRRLDVGVEVRLI